MSTELETKRENVRNVFQSFVDYGDRRKKNSYLKLIVLVLLALGGGSFLNKNVRKEVLMKHISFWLYLDDFRLIKRIKDNPKRPIAFNSTKETLVDLIKKRSKMYSKALFKIDCNNLTKKNIATKVIKIYENKKIKN